MMPNTNNFLFPQTAPNSRTLQLLHSPSYAKEYSLLFLKKYSPQESKLEVPPSFPLLGLIYRAETLGHVLAPDRQIYRCNHDFVLAVLSTLFAECS